MLTRFKNLSRKKKVIVLTVLFLVMLSASRYFLGSSHFSRMTALENRLEEKGASIGKTYIGPNSLANISDSLLGTRFEIVIKPFYKTHGFYLSGVNLADDLWDQISKADFVGIQLNKINISKNTLKKLLNSPNLGLLEISESDFSDKHFKILINKTFAEYKPLSLLLQNNKLTDISTKDLPEVFIRSIHCLNLSNNLITDKTLQNISVCRNLQFLYLSGNKITDKGVTYLKTKSNIDYLWLNNTLITDKSLVHISNMEKMVSLDLSNTNITDDGIQKLVKLTRLNQLYLRNNRITDKSIPYFIKMKSLRSLNIEGTKISPEGYQELKSKLPKCVIRYKSNSKSP